MPPMVKLIHPDGHEVVTNENGVDGLLDQGYEHAPEPKADSADSGPNLKKMKLDELLAHAEEVGVDEDTLAELHDGGTKAQVIEAIESAKASES